MADYFTYFSCSFDLGSPAHAAPALALYAQMEVELEADQGEAIGFYVEADPSEPSRLWFHDGGGYGEPEHVIAFVLRCAEAFTLSGRWGFCWALTCSRSCEDGFGGGAQVLDLERRRSLAWTDCSHWLAMELAA